MKESLSIQQARKLVLLSQRLPPVKQMGRAIAATLSAIEHLGYIQIDTISVIQRAHHHTLWNRNPRYRTSHLNQLLVDKQVFEYWSHAAAYLPMRDYRYSLARKQAIANGDQNHWYERDERLMKSVLKRIATEGPLMAKDFGHRFKKTGELLQISAGGNTYYVLPASLDLLSKPLARSKLKILSPFDNLLIQRKRMRTLFGFDYLIECYVPEAKRQYGYFSLPVLWDGRLVARMDCKTERKKSLLHIHHLALEPWLVKTDVFFHALRNELASFMQFNNCSHLRLHKTSPARFKPVLQSVITNSWHLPIQLIEPSGCF